MFKKVCSMKTLAVLVLAFVGMVTLNIQVANATELSAEENATLIQWLSVPSSRARIEKEYWEDVVLQVAELRAGLPTRIHPNSTMVGAEVDVATRTATYSYNLDSVHGLDLFEMRDGLTNSFCHNPVVAHYLTIMRGSIQYIYYGPSDIPRVYGSFTISLANCGPGI